MLMSNSIAPVIIAAPTSPVAIPVTRSMWSGFFVFAAQQRFYIDAAPDPQDPDGWWMHRFITMEGRLLRVWLPANAHIHLWCAGDGPHPNESIARRGNKWAWIPKTDPMTLSAKLTQRYLSLYLGDERFRSLPPTP